MPSLDAAAHHVTGRSNAVGEARVKVWIKLISYSPLSVACEETFVVQCPVVYGE